MRELVVEADGGSRGNPGPAGYGAVVLDPATGETLAEAAEYIGVATNNVAEYKGLVAGLKAARELFPDAAVHVRMDSKLVVEQMSGRWKIKHPDMKPLAAEAARVFPPGRVRYEWIPRERNKHADRLANEAMDAGKRGRQWEPSASTAGLDAAAARNAAAPPPSGPPGDATAGAAMARAALTGTAAAVSTTGTGSGAWPGGVSRPTAPDTAPDDGLFAAEEAVAASVASGDFEAAAGALAPVGHAARTHAPATGGPATRAETPDASAEPGAPAQTGAAAAPAGLAVTPGAAVAPPQARTTPPARAAAPSAQSGAAPRQGWSGPDMGAPATFVLLRHGETALTPEKRFSGSGGSDPELSAAGTRQAEAVAEALAARGTIQEIVSSPLARCRQTAGAVAARLGLDVRIEQGLRETDFGAWEGLTFGEVRERYPEDLDAWLASPKAAPTGGGESFATVARRVAATRDRLTAAYAGRTVLLVTHVTPIKTLVRLALGAPPESLFRMELSAASISAVAYYADGNASVRLLNDTSHLR
ncbi:MULTISPECIES: bifunctional RNase H/acid phosphatase [Streptomyces]|jgi:ribonuclease H / adenosylcobalamin/alpha-ribazole phosphatase|uniref:Putative phosphoglycerate mutase n=1 Tax=Streptomyces nymphaeiformis TaxID=2663842 RepID=A0A7W7X9W0_9ACTN|nr:bifunctional RNase H/acid phosphatase [Streptomyces nymphaeiformis]MBB4979801.1 putative phosphoglycerate mutase [Streptomyces nymphaeiformis]